MNKNISPDMLAVARQLRFRQREDRSYISCNARDNPRFAEAFVDLLNQLGKDISYDDKDSAWYIKVEDGEIVCGSRAIASLKWVGFDIEAKPAKPVATKSARQRLLSKRDKIARLGHD